VPENSVVEEIRSFQITKNHGKWCLGSKDMDFLVMDMSEREKLRREK
jgi:hypothetical protein